MRSVIVLALVLAVGHAWAQGEGSILLNDGTTSKGNVSYSHLTGIVSFQSGSVSKTFNARSLAGFEYNQRRFYSIPYQTSSGIVKQFFEVVREYKDFAVIAQTTVLPERMTSELTTLFFMQASDLKVIPYLEVLNRDVKWEIFDINKRQVRVLNSSLPKKIMGSNFEKVKAFAKEKKLVWHVKESLLSILDYYDTLIK